MSEKTVDTVKYWNDRNKKLRKMKYTEFKEKHMKDYHYKLGCEECARRARFCQTQGFKIPYDEIIDIDNEGITKPNNYTDKTWGKVFAYEYAHEYWSLISHIISRENQIAHPKTMHFEHKDIIITDPCYIINDNEDWLSKAESIKSGMFTDTLYGDWSCHVFDIDTEKPIGQFCADAGMVCVYPLDEPLLDKEAVEEFLKKDWCATVIKDFTGDVSFVRHAGKEGEYGFEDWLTVEGRGSVNFSGRQTGF
jgi:hypothetical protein